MLRSAHRAARAALRASTRLPLAGQRFTPAAPPVQRCAACFSHAPMSTQATHGMDATAQSSNTPTDATAAQYSALLHQLLTINSERKVRMGITTTQRLLTALGPDFDIAPIPVIHVAGSNGKGSTTLKIARALQLHGLRVGAYTSPHLSSFRERIAVDGVMMSQEDFNELMPRMLEVASRPSSPSNPSEDIPATFFELGTALAFGYFRKAQVDVAVLEVGLGGRLDSTNVVAQPELSIVCSISLEHTQWLGDTIEAITREKAGIVKRGRPVLLGPSVPRDVVEEVARGVGAGPIEQIDMDQSFAQDYDRENSALASRALRIVAEQSQRIATLLQQRCGGLKDELVEQGVRVRPPCRFQQVRWDPLTGKGAYIDEDGSRGVSAADARKLLSTTGEERSVDVVLDVCHNPAAFARLFEKLRREYAAPAASTTSSSLSSASPSHPSASSPPSPPLDVRAVVGFSSDKDFVACLHMLMRNCTEVAIVQGDTPRAADAMQVMRSAQDNKLSELYPHCRLSLHSRSPYETLKRMLTDAAAVTQPGSPSPLILCCGTFFIMSDVRRALGLPHPIDPVAVNEQSLARSSSTPAAGTTSHAASTSATP